MTVAIIVGNEIQAYGPSTTPWMPVWQVSSASTEQTLYSWDSTFALRKRNGTQLRDRISYRLTSRFVGNETVAAAGGSITSEKYSVQITITETIDSLIGSATYPMYNGYSLQMTGNLWIANGVGPVKGDISGLSLPGRRGLYGHDVFLYSYTGGTGYEQIFFSSPRLSYDYYEVPGFPGSEYLWINTQPLSAAGSYSFVLAAKSF